MPTDTLQSRKKCLSTIFMVFNTLRSIACKEAPASRLIKRSFFQVTGQCSHRHMFIGLFNSMGIFFIAFKFLTLVARSLQIKHLHKCIHHPYGIIRLPGCSALWKLSCLRSVPAICCTDYFYSSKYHYRQVNIFVKQWKVTHMEREGFFYRLPCLRRGSDVISYAVMPLQTTY